MENRLDLTDLLKYIDPGSLTYQEWCNVGMALKEEGYAAADWDLWSQKDPKRYHAGECFKKWGSFQGAGGMPVTGATITQMAKDSGWTPAKSADVGDVLEWDDIIGNKDELVVVDKAWVEAREVTEPATWDPVNQLIMYLETLFDSTENVGYVTTSWEKDGRYLPSKGNWDRTAGQLIQELGRCKGDISRVFGDYQPECGAWIRFNPMDGQGCKNENVTDFRYALVESDEMAIDEQNALIRELELPVACLVHSGKKSIHAIVRIDAPDYNEYRKRVDYLYKVCEKNGLKIDNQNRNPSRLSRMPGVVRNNRKQFLIDTNIGKGSWAEWQEWIEGINDDLPEPENMADVWNNLPELAPPLIEGVLRQGHKMLMAGPSKAGKSFALIELCCAIAEGKKWMGWQCTQGRVLYVNLELDRASCLHRFRDVYNALGWDARSARNIDIWNLRGSSEPMNKLAPKLIRRAKDKGYIAIVIDPIYKIITGDENSADQMALFCNQFDKVCTELSAAVIYCHHHSKGSQGGKRSMDRASGSGVFARDPDALIDLIELELTDDIRKTKRDEAGIKICIDAINQHLGNIDDIAGWDDQQSIYKLKGICKLRMTTTQYEILEDHINAAEKTADAITAWRIDGTLREFPKFAPVNAWFDYPVHSIDETGVLGDIEPESDQPAWKKNFSKKKTPEERAEEKKQALEIAFDANNVDGNVTIKDLTEHMGISEKTVRRRIKEHGGYWVDEGKVGKK